MQRIENRDPIKSHPRSLISPSPKNSFSSSSSSSDFEFTVSISPRKSSTALCPADDLFCNGHLLPLHHHSRRNSLVPTLLPSSSTSSSATASTSRDSTASSSTSATDSRSSSQSDSYRPAPADDDDHFKKIRQRHDRKCKQFSFSRFSSVFRSREPKSNNNVDLHASESQSSRPVRGRGIGSTAKEVIKKYFRKVQQKIGKSTPSPAAAVATPRAAESASLASGKTEEGARFSLSFSGNLRYPRGRSSFLPSCPSSTRSSPSHSGVLRRGGVQSMSSASGSTHYSADMSSMEELHSAIQGAIAHCKNSLIQNNNTINADESNNNTIS